MPLAGRDLITIDDLSDEDVETVLRQAEEYAGDRLRPLTRDELPDKVVATLFFEPSTRTRISFETAAHRLGARVVGFADPGVSSLKKGETLEDTVRTVAAYADCIVMRHSESGSAARAADAADVPVINAGDGDNAHPTQSLLDLFTIRKERGPGPQHVVLIGDLKHGRTVHSLAVLLTRFGHTLTLVAPPGLEMPRSVIDACRHAGGTPTETHELGAVVGDADVLYVTRVQQERFADPAEYKRLVGSYTIDTTLLSRARSDVTILHPLPRVGEIHPDVDTHAGAAYFRQVANGVPVRMALLRLILQEPAT